jgi:predicted dinucleotide-binding enzyme
MKVGILGSGDVGQALGNGFLSRGHEVKLGAREATNEKAVKWAAKHGGKTASAGTFKDAAAFGETLVLATLWSGTENAISFAGKESFKGNVWVQYGASTGTWNHAFKLLRK